MKLTNMKLARAALEARGEPASVAPDAPVYPWGLSVTLEEAALEKLDLELPKVGATLLLVARVDVTSVSSNESLIGKNRNVSLQITDLALGPEATDLSDKLYARRKGD
jgi:hypothetical protein